MTGTERKNPEPPKPKYIKSLFAGIWYSPAQRLPGEAGEYLTSVRHKDSKAIQEHRLMMYAFAGDLGVFATGPWYEVVAWMAIPGLSESFKEPYNGR